MDKKKLLGFVIGGGLLVIAVAMAILFYFRGKQMTDMPVITRTLLVTMTKPMSGSRAVVGEPLLVSAEAVGQYPVHSLELWVDGKLVDRTNSQNLQLTQLNGLWNWNPDREGLSTLSVRGKDVRGQTAISNLARVEVLPAGNSAMQILQKEGESLASLAGKFNVNVDAAAELNPGVDPNASPSADQLIQLPAPSGGSLPPGYTGPSTPGESSADSPEDESPMPVPNPTPEPNEVPPSVPGISIETIDNCNIRISVKANSNNADEYHVFILRPEADKMDMVFGHGPMATNETFEYVEKNAYGTYQIFAEAVNTVGSASSDPETYLVSNGTCSAFGKASIDVKVLTRSSIGRLYCYVTIDGMTYVHVPNTSDSYITPMDKYDLQAWKKKSLPYAQLASRSGFDLTPHLPAIHPKGSGTSQVKFECWDWDGQTNLGPVIKNLTDEELKTFAIFGNDNYDVMGIFGGNAQNYASHAQISAPYNLRLTGNPKLCSQHESLQACETYIKIGMAAFVWDYHQQKCFPGTEAFCQYLDIDGFRIYRHYKTGQSPQLAYGVAGKEKVTGGFTQWPTSPCAPTDAACMTLNQPCYTVRAYKGGIESRDSNEVCLGDKSKSTGLKKINISPSHLSVGGAYHFVNKNIEDESIQVTDYSDHTGISKDGTITVGHDYYNYEGYYILGIEQHAPQVRDYDYFGFIQFLKLDELMGRTIQSAVLKFNMLNTTHEIDSHWNYIDACAKAIGTAKSAAYWGVASSAPKYTFISKLPLQFTSDEIRVDVTDAVKAWSQGQTNYGFVMDGRSGSVVYTTFEKCYTQYANFLLEVEFFPNP